MNYTEGYAKVFVDSALAKKAVNREDLLNGEVSFDKVVRDVSYSGWYISLDSREYNIMLCLDGDLGKSEKVLAEILGEYGRYAWNVHMVFVPVCIAPDSPIKGSFSGKTVSAKFDT